jgi:Ca-activated chloride channel family protein
MPCRRPLVLWSLFSLFLFSASTLAAQGGGPPLGERFRAWLADVDILITPRERAAFLRLQSDADRDAFRERFWQVRDPYPETPRNEARERWEERLAAARGRWDRRDDRSRIYLLNGEPDAVLATRCAGRPVEVWSNDPKFQVRFHTVLAFLIDPAGGPARLWRPGDAPDLLDPAVVAACEGEAAVQTALTWLRRAGKEGCEIVAQRAMTPPQPREWVSELSPRTADPGPADRPSAPALPARLDVDFPGRPGEGLVRVLVEPAAQAPAPSAVREMILRGRVLRGVETVDAFRYRFDALPAGGLARPLAFERQLRPGRYRIEVEMEAPASGRVYAAERELAVPEAAAAAANAAAAVSSPGVPPEVRRLYEEADAELAAPRPGLRFAAPSGSLLAGTQHFEARVERAAGAPDTAQIERVAFALDGKPLLTRNRPPFAVQIDLGRVPRPHRLAAQGLGRDGAVLASDELMINAGAQRFAVHVAEPAPGRTYRRSLRARVEVEAPEGRSVERMELYLGERRVATLYQPPWVQPIVLPDAAAASYVRAVAYLADGTAAEDLALLNAPGPAEVMDIRLVELYARIQDAKGRPVEGLDSGQLLVLEDGVRQSLRQVESVDDTPLRLATLIDNSASMRPRLDAARGAALDFLRRTLRPRDEAAVITFNRAPRVVVGLTGDLAALEGGLAGLVADDATALWDSLIFSLYYLGGASGQRAVLLLSDGEDRTSGFGYAAALECARRAGVAIYAVGVGLREGEPVERLSRLAAETGGSSFFLKGMDELPAVYAAIERDLRSRYRITYQSSNTHPGEAFRAVKVEVGKPGMEARTISGYYP